MSSSFDKHLEALPFSEEKQSALLGHLVDNDSFYRQARSQIEPEWFADPLLAKIWGARVGFDQKYGRPPTLHELLETPTFVEEEGVVRERMRARVETARHATRNFPLDVLAPELTDWLRSRIYQTRMKESERLYNSGRQEEAYNVVKSMSKEVDSASFEGERG